MRERTVAIVGGGLAGLAAGCYARASGYRTTILEHNLALGGVCTAWPRGPYVVDGCIHWLTGGPFTRIYEELGILPRVKLRTLEEWTTWRDERDGSALTVSRNLARVASDLRLLGPDDSEEIDRLVDEADRFAELSPGVDRPMEITSLRDQLRAFWQMRGAIPTLAHFRKPIGTWVDERIRSDALRRFFTSLMPGTEAPALLLLMVLGYMKRGWLSRPVGGSGAFRDALVDTYERLGGRAELSSTVDEVLVEGGRACGVRLGDGTILQADAVISTSSLPETVLRLLGGRHEAEPTRERMQKWKMFQPVVLASVGVEAPLEDVPAMQLVDGVPPFTVGGRTNARIGLRVCKDDPALAPPGHAVVQSMLETDYDWWATRGTGYVAAKDEVARVALQQIERVLPEVAGKVRMTDIATPLTYWRQTRSWHGAYEGWVPTSDSIFGHIKKKLSKLDGFYMAGQWVEPGGGVPTALMSGRQAVQILCADDDRPFAIPVVPAAGG